MHSSLIRCLSVLVEMLETSLYTLAEATSIKIVRFHLVNGLKIRISNYIKYKAIISQWLDCSTEKHTET